MSKEAEVAQGRNIADAAKAAGVQHVIWSTLPHASVLTDGLLRNVEYFDSKAEVDIYMRSLGFPTMTSFEIGFYMSNLLTMMRPGPDGIYTLAWPVPAHTRLPLVSAVDDGGKFVASILARPPNLPSPPERVMAASGWWSGQDIVDTFSRLHGPAHRAVYAELPADVWKATLPFPEAVAQGWFENFLLIRDYEYYGPGVAEAGVREALAALDGQDKPVSLEEFFAKAGLW